MPAKTDFELPDVLLQRILGSAKMPRFGDPGRAPGAKARQDGRTSTRFQVSLRATITRIVDGEAESAGLTPRVVRVRDVSSGGAGLLCAEAFKSGDQFVLRVPTGRATLPLLCQACHVKLLSEGLYLIGAKYLGIAREATAPRAAATTALAAQVQTPTPAQSPVDAEIQRIRQPMLG